MEGPLLHVFLFLMASRGGSGQLLGKLCYSPLKEPQSHLVAYYCPGFQDPADARFCCGTCSEPFCCASQKNNLDPTRCPAFNQVPEVNSSTTPVPLHDGRLNVLWCFVGILLGSIVVLSLCRNYRVFKCRRFCGDSEEEEEEEVEMEERRSPFSLSTIRLPPPSPPSPIRCIDYPPPYSAIDPHASLPLPLTNAPLRMGPTDGAPPARFRGAEGGSPPGLPGAEGGSPPGLPGAEDGSPPGLREAEDGSPPGLPGAEDGSPPGLRGAEGGFPPGLRGAEGGSPPRLRGAEWGARSRLRGAEWGAPARFPEAEWGDLPPPYPDDPPPYSLFDPFAPPSLPPMVSAPRRKRRAKASRSVQRAPADLGAVWGAPAEPLGAVGGAPAEPLGAVWGDPGEPAGAVGGAPAEPPGAEGGVPAEPFGAEAGAFAM